MKVEKFKNYNQVILAVLGTVLLLIAVIGLILITVITIDEIRSSRTYNNQTHGILSDEKIEELQKENKRKQLISYETPRLVDTLNLVYIIPVSHKTLQGAEVINEQLLGLMNLSNDFEYEIDTRYSNKYYGDFNNLLIYEYINGSVERLFASRVNFRNIQTEYFDDDILILLQVATTDTYKDGVINQRDYKTLYIYSLKNKALKEIKLENTDVYQVDFVENSKDLLIKFGLDHNRDGTFDEYTEPTLIMKYDYTSGELQNIVSEEMDRELQMRLQGTEQ